jgi:multiple sugar transport system ATP-binding protein
LLTARLLEGDHLVQLRAEPDQQLVPGQSVHLEVDPHGWRLFDGAGEAIPRPEPAATPGREPVLPELG